MDSTRNGGKRGAKAMPESGERFERKPETGVHYAVHLIVDTCHLALWQYNAYVGVSGSK